MRNPEFRRGPENHFRCARAFVGVNTGGTASVALPVAPKYQEEQAVKQLYLNGGSYEVWILG